jgi:hypothetical protein
MAKKKKHKKSKRTERPAVVDGEFYVAADGQAGNRVFVSMGKTINIGNYESVRVEYGEVKVVQDGEDFNATRDNCATRVLNSVKEMISIVEEALK